MAPAARHEARYLVSIHRPVQVVVAVAILLGAALAFQSAQARAGSSPALAFIHGGNLWITTVPGEPRQVTHDGHACCPTWSADGRWLAFRDDSHLAAVARDGREPAIVTSSTQVGAYAWSPLGDLLAYADQAGIHVALAPGWPGRLVAPQGGGLAWSPDSTSLAMTQPGAAGDGRTRPDTAIVEVDGNGGATRPLYAPSVADEGLILAGWAGDRLLFWPDPGFSASLLADGVPLEVLSTAQGRPATGPARLVPVMLADRDFLSVAPDHQHVAVAQGGGRFTWSEKRIAVVDLARGTTTALTPPSVVAVDPAWSPSGDRIAYVAGPDAGNVGGGAPAKEALAGRRVWVARPDGTGMRQVTDDPRYRDERPQWSADGSHLLIARLDATGHASLWLVPVDGGVPVEVAVIAEPGVLGLAVSQRQVVRHLDWDAAFAWLPGPRAQLPQAGSGGGSEATEFGLGAATAAALAVAAVITLRTRRHASERDHPPTDQTGGA